MKWLERAGKSMQTFLFSDVVSGLKVHTQGQMLVLYELNLLPRPTQEALGFLAALARSGPRRRKEG